MYLRYKDILLIILNLTVQIHLLSFIKNAYLELLLLQNFLEFVNNLIFITHFIIYILCYMYVIFKKFNILIF